MIGCFRFDAMGSRIVADSPIPVPKPKTHSSTSYGRFEAIDNPEHLGFNRSIRSRFGRKSDSIKNGLGRAVRPSRGKR